MLTYRVLVSTDLGGDPDDIQSLFRLLHYSDVLRIEGLSSCTGPGSQPSAELIQHWIQRVDLDHLRGKGFPELMSEQQVLSLVRQGSKIPRPPAPGAATPASQQIIERAHAHDPLNRPLWVLVWGSLTDVAQALHDDPLIAPKIRIHYIGSNNTVNDPRSRDFVFDFMASRCPSLWWIENGVLPVGSRETFRGVYRGGDQTGELGHVAFVQQNIRGRGSNHQGLFSERCGDAFPLAKTLGGLKEGDSPTLLYLLSPVFGGVGNVDDPTAESWGGQYHRPQPQRFANYCTDLPADAATCQSTISRWRRAFLSHWKERWGRYG